MVNSRLILCFLIALCSCSTNEKKVPEAVLSSKEEKSLRNPFFEIDCHDAIEIGSDSQDTIIEKKVFLGESLGSAVLKLIAEGNKDEKIAMLIYNGKENVVNKMLTDDSVFYQGTLVALDLDGDQQKELLFHTGDTYNIYVFSIIDSGLQLIGRLECNNGFELTDDYRMIATIGLTTPIIREYEYTDGHLILINEEQQERNHR